MSEVDRQVLIEAALRVADLFRATQQPAEGERPASDVAKVNDEVDPSDEPKPRPELANQVEEPVRPLGFVRKGVQREDLIEVRTTTVEHRRRVRTRQHRDRRMGPSVPERPQRRHAVENPTHVIAHRDHDVWAVTQRIEIDPVGGWSHAVSVRERGLAGMPTTVVSGGTSFTTTALAPTCASSPSTMGPRTLAPAPRNTRLPMRGNSRSFRIPTVTAAITLQFSPMLCGASVTPDGCAMYRPPPNALPITMSRPYRR